MPCHEVRPLSGINQEGYENYVLIVHDHYYSVDPLTIFAETLVSADEVKRAQVEKTTREQSQHLWFKERECRLTASNFGKICRTRDPEKLARQLRMRSNFQNNNMKWGLQMEGLARMRFEEITDNRVVRCGLIIHPEKSYLAASCDGLIGNEGVLELKGLPSQKNYKISVNAVPYLQMIGWNVVLKRNYNYFYQVQGQLYVTGRQYCCFVVYTAVDMLIIEVERDNVFIQEMSLQLDKFYKEYFVPSLLS
ncbi:hypothetical protein ANN_19218 [Periplaneta americana]|uniref:YqaJ viral recombinase domain-containing protein n=1 Tax=Periplaneta americana TaxID=6978 RepID=A0ABQ8S988_PERAM|nr:hypothetical protein ANN_19218 [Periplaneta americana]